MTELTRRSLLGLGLGAGAAAALSACGGGKSASEAAGGGANPSQTFSATCSNPSGQEGAQQVTFDVTANTTADMDANGGPQPAGTKINVHTNSDAMDTTPDNQLNPGDFDQVGSASSSTEIAADGQEVDVFYNDGVNWPSSDGTSAHDCFAGYTGFLG